MLNFASFMLPRTYLMPPNVASYNASDCDCDWVHAVVHSLLRCVAFEPLHIAQYLCVWCWFVEADYSCHTQSVCLSASYTNARSRTCVYVRTLLVEVALVISAVWYDCVFMRLKVNQLLAALVRATFTFICCLVTEVDILFWWDPTWMTECTAHMP